MTLRFLATSVHLHTFVGATVLLNRWIVSIFAQLTSSLHQD